MERVKLNFLNIIKTVLAYSITAILITVWLVFCFFISLIGTTFYKKRVLINLQEVKKRQTICSVLTQKKLLTNQEYEFETKEVAVLYDELTFRGYLFVLSPVIFLLKHTTFADSFVLYLVKKWMHLHKYQRKYKKKPKSFFSYLMSFCVLLAFFVGQVLYRIK